MLVAFNRQVRQLSAELQGRECGLVELGRQYARDFDAGHSPSGSGVQRVLAELRKLAVAAEAPAVSEPTTPPESRKANGIADLTARIAARRNASPDPGGAAGGVHPGS